ncbi:MAG: AmmeMemoRadiSam system radical SAM enzyme [Candidatus Aminicenantes bacterium]|nr:AmmeMemoRadiSam system radical SAM enzyme [Candidatus Aminicenantes bacterium]
MKRRAFLTRAGGAALAAPLLLRPAGSAAAAPQPRGREAAYYEKLPDQKVVCRLCPHQCQVADLERGTCGVRENRGGTYYTLVYGQPCAVHVDPVEKKPLFHYYPGSQAYSLATAGCNFTCRFCQNWEISQRRPEQVRWIDMPPADVVRRARAGGCRLVAHTYGEPVIFFEYMRDCAALGREQGVPNVMISNGFIEKAPMRELCRHLGAVKIDLKAFTETFYAEQCGGRLKPVLDTLLTVRAEGTWLEVVVLLIPGLNDGREEIERMCRWLVRELGRDVPLHFSRFVPTFMMKNIPPTPPATLHGARRIAMDAGVRFCYVGNLLSDAEHTFCPACGKVLLRRLMYSVENAGLKDGRCRFCGEEIPGVFS